MLIYWDPLGKSWFCNSSQVYCSQLYGMYIIKVSIVSSHVFIVLVHTTFDETWSLKHMNNPITPTSKYKQHPWGLDPWNDPRFRANIWTHVTHATSQPLAALHNEARVFMNSFWNFHITPILRVISGLFFNSRRKILLKSFQGYFHLVNIL